MKKIMFLICLLILLTGCTAKYNVKINEDLSIIEEVYMYGDDDLYSTYYKTTHMNVLKELLEPFEDILKENKYEYSVNEEGYIYITKKYVSIKEYIDSSILFNNYFDKIDYNKNEKSIKIETEGFYPNSTDDPDRFYVKDLDIAITSSYKVLNHNASKVDDKTNTYFFNIKEDTEDFKLMLEIDTTSKFNPYVKMYIKILVAFLIVLTSWIVVFYLNKKKKF